MVSIAQARPFLFRLQATLVRVPVTARFNRSSATIPLPTSRKLAGPRIVQKVSIAQARPFLFRRGGSRAETGTWKQFQSLKRDHSSSDKAKRRFITSFMYKFQSLKRDHSSSDPVSRENRCIPSSVSIAQARPFLFRRSLSQRRAVFSESFNRSSATIPLPTAASRNAQAGSIELCFNRSSATIPLPTARAKSTGTRAELRFNRSSATIPLPTSFACIRNYIIHVCFNRSSATIPLPTPVL